MSNSQMLLVMMGGPPGSGKSTLAEGLVTALGPRAMLFGEEALFEMPEFSEIALSFSAKTFPDTTMMLDAYSAFIERVRGETNVVVFDWSCVGMIEDLPCAQRDRTSVTTYRLEQRADPEVLSGHARDVRMLANEAVLLVLETPIATAISRVLEQRGEQWFDPWREVVGFQGEGTFLDHAVQYWDRGVLRHEDCVRGHATGGWDVFYLDATMAPDEVLAKAVNALAPFRAKTL